MFKSTWSCSQIINYYLLSFQGFPWLIFFICRVSQTMPLNNYWKFTALYFIVIVVTSKSLALCRLKDWDTPSPSSNYQSPWSICLVCYLERCIWLVSVDYLSLNFGKGLGYNGSISLTVKVLIQFIVDPQGLYATPVSVQQEAKVTHHATLHESCPKQTRKIVCIGTWETEVHL